MLFVRCITLLLLLYMNNNVCMLINEVPIVPTLKQLCIKAVRKIVAASDINDLVKKENFEKYSNLPESLKNKIVKVPMFFKLGHEFVYEDYESRIFKNVHLDEDSNHVCFIDEKDKKIKIFKMGEKEKINFTEISKITICKFVNKRSVICWSDSSAIHILKKGIEYNVIDLPRAFGNLYEIYNNQRILCIYHHNIGKLLFDLDTKSFLMGNYVKHIQFDANEKLCLIQDLYGIFTLYNMQNPAKYQKIQSFNNVKNAVINPNGKNIIISTQDNKCAFVSIMGSIMGKTLFEIEDDTYVPSAHFNDTGDYVIVPHFNSKGGLKYNIINTNNGIICFSVQLSMNSEISFYKKFLILVVKDTIAYLIRIKDLFKINNELYTFNDIKRCNIIYKFENVDNFYCKSMKDKSHLFHPSGNYIITIKDKVWKLIHIKSQECVAKLENVLNYHFSEPTGKMLCINYENNYKVFNCRNDFTLEEVLLNRLITENDKYQSVFSKFSFSKNLEQNL